MIYHIDHVWPHCSQEKLKKILPTKNIGIKYHYNVEDYGWPRKDSLFENKIISEKKSE
jgi:hypothetical protein